MSARHTSGPWQADNFLCDDEHPLRIGMPDRNGVPTATIAFCEHNWNDSGPYDRRISWAEAEANARLIAAAPDLLEALQHILGGALSLPRFAEAEARAAIAKALGEQA